MTDQYCITKSRVKAFLQCPKRAYLQQHNPGCAATDTSPAALTGHAVGTYVKSLYTNGVEVKHCNQYSPDEITAQLIDNQTDDIFEASFTHNNVNVRIDVLSNNGNGYTINEVKAKTSVTDDVIIDAAIQYYVATQSGANVTCVNAITINKDFVYNGNDYHGLMQEQDITERCLMLQNYIAQVCQSTHSCINGAEPCQHTSSHCNKPVACEFKEHCKAQNNIEFPVSSLPNGHKLAAKLYSENITDIRQIPTGIKLAKFHERVTTTVQSGKPYVDIYTLGEVNNMVFPITYLDFETVQFAIPAFIGTKPYQQIPFQLSAHTEYSNGEVEHAEYLDLTGDDPRRNFAEQLIKVCGKTGSIAVYNKSFEKMIITQLASDFDDLKAPLMAIADRLFDLLPVMKNGYYHQDMHGSWSIKSVLPVVAPHLSYASVGMVQDGAQASLGYITATTTHDPLMVSDIRRALLAYCKLDTRAMIEIAYWCRRKVDRHRELQQCA